MVKRCIKPSDILTTCVEKRDATPQFKRISVRSVARSEQLKTMKTVELHAISYTSFFSLFFWFGLAWFPSGISDIYYSIVKSNEI